MTKPWTAPAILELCRTFQPAALLAAAVDLELFDACGTDRRTAAQLARRLRCDLRGLTQLLDALVALDLLTKRQACYSVPASVAQVLTRTGSASVLAMAQHQANCYRRWGQLAQVIRTGQPAARVPSVRGAARDAAAFIGAMHDLNVRVADQIVAEIQPVPVTHLLDVGGGSGTWTIAWLRVNPATTATIFDLPHVIPLARQRLAQAGLLARVKLVAGDFESAALPQGADLAWVSAIIHQNSRRQNRELFRKVGRALPPGGRIVIRDFLMEPSRTAPRTGALFAVNMRVHTAGGGTYTWAELRADLAAAGFGAAKVARRDDGMFAILIARKKPFHPPGKRA